MSSGWESVAYHESLFKIENLTKKPWDLFDETVGGHESVVSLSEFLNKLLVLVQLLQIFSTLKWGTWLIFI